MDAFNFNLCKVCAGTGRFKITGKTCTGCNGKRWLYKGQKMETSSPKEIMEIEEKLQKETPKKE